MIAAFLLRYWLQLLAVAVVVAGVWWGVHAFHERDLRLIEQGRQEVRAAELKEAQRVAGEFAKAVATNERDALIRLEHRNEAFDRIKGVAIRLPAPIRSVAVPAPVVELLNSAVGEANGPAGPAAKPDATPSAASNLGEVTEWAVEVVRVCTLYRDRVWAWERFYGNLQDILGP